MSACGLLAREPGWCLLVEVTYGFDFACTHEEIGLPGGALYPLHGGGIFTSFLLELLVYPGIYGVWKWHFEMRRAENVEASQRGSEERDYVDT